MPYQLQQLIEGRPKPVSVKKADSLQLALDLMARHDYSQLPVVSIQGSSELPEGMITYEAILRGVRNFNTSVSGLTVRQVMSRTTICGGSDELFDTLDRLKQSSAILVQEEESGALVGIITSYDVIEFFRNRLEWLVEVEDVEVSMKEMIITAYSDGSGNLNEKQLGDAIDRVTKHLANEKPRSFDDLSFAEYASLLLFGDTWTYFEPVFGVPRDAVRVLLDSVREIRNSLAHFRNDISADQSDRLAHAASWIARCRDELGEKRHVLRQGRPSLRELESPDLLLSSPRVSFAAEKSVPYEVNDSALGGGRYARFADWLQSKPVKKERLDLTFAKIEEIIGFSLPSFARRHRSWWANDSVGHGHSQLWLDAGWRSSYLNLKEETVSFVRIRERQLLYIRFYSKLMDKLKQDGRVSIRLKAIDGTNWIPIQAITVSGRAFGSFVFSFSRDRRFRVELYLDLKDKGKTEAAFDALMVNRAQFEEKVGAISWERLDNRRATRLALYNDGQIDEEANHEKLIEWGVAIMPKFMDTLKGPAEKAIAEVIRG